MNNKMLINAVHVLALACCLLDPAMAHEDRRFGSYDVAVGFRVEPASEDVPNAFDFFVSHCSNASCSTSTGLDIDKGDTVNLTVRAIVLQKEAFNATIISNVKLTGEFRQDFSTPNRYNIWFKPVENGVYGFILSGTVRKKGKTARSINSKWVCGKGSRSKTSRFSCVQDFQTVPAQGAIDKKGYQDND